MHILSTGYVQVCDKEVYGTLDDYFNDEFESPSVTTIEEIDEFLEQVCANNGNVDWYKAELEYDKIKEHLKGADTAVQFYRD